MPGHLHIRRVDPESPAMAAEAIAREIGAAAPHDREVCVLSVSRGDTRGLAVAPWTEAGVRRAHEGATVRVQALPHPLGRRAHASAERSPSDMLALTWPGVERPLRVPHAWLGRRLVLLAPCVVTSTDRRVPLGHGPVAAAFEALALALGAPSTGDASGLGARVAAHVFAHVGVIIDASWSTVVDLGIACEPTARCIGVESPCPTADGRAVSVRDIDAWLVRRLGLVASAVAPAFSLHGSGDESPWMRSSIGTLPVGALADREVAPLWQSPAGAPPPRPRRPRPRHTDALDRAWAVWTEGRA